MATPMRTSSQAAGHRGARVADPNTSGSAYHHPTAHLPPPPRPPSATTTTTTNSHHVQQQQPAAANFEYDDNEWDIGIGDLIIDLDADIEKTTEVVNMAANAGQGGPAAPKAQATAKMHIEHSATSADKGLKMKIKRTKPGTKTSEAKHEIVKSNELTNGVADPKAGPAVPDAAKPPSPPNPAANKPPRSSGHRRDKTRDKHPSSSTATDKPLPKAGPSGATPTVAATVSEMRATAPGPPRNACGPGPPSAQGQASGPSPGPPQSPAAATAQGSAAKPEQAKGAGPVGAGQVVGGTGGGTEERGTSPPPAKKIKTDGKEVADVCVGTSVGTITEPDCLGPCEPGTSVTLEGIVWHETEGGVLVVNVTWRGKTYVGTLLDCTRHDWAPPRFCDSPTSDLDNRAPKGRETRSSAHSKLRNGSGGGSGGSGAGGSGGQGGGLPGGPKGARKGTPASPAPPFPPPRPDATNKRKSRAGDEAADRDGSGQAPSVKKSKTTVSTPSAPLTVPPCGSPPPSPVLLECPEPNCSKKYKHINGLKYHQSHAHGSPDDDDTKDVASTSENDESSNIEAPSPSVPPKERESPTGTAVSVATPIKKEATDLPNLLRGSASTEETATPISTPPSPVTPQGTQEPLPSATTITTTASPTVPLAEPKGGGVVKPGVLRFSAPPSEDYPVGLFSGSKPQVQGTTISSAGPLLPTNRTTPVTITPVDQTPIQTPEPAPPQPQSFASQLQSQVSMPSQQFTQPPSIVIPNASGIGQLQPSQLSPHSPPNPPGKIAQFKVKPASALMPDDKKPPQHLAVNNSGNKPSNFNKKKNRKSPAGSPDIAQPEQLMFGAEQTGRDEVQSPAYSDISDDGAPVLDAEMVDKNKHADKKSESSQALPPMAQYGMYHQFYSQQQYLVPSVQESKPKEPEKQQEKLVEKEGKKEGLEYPQKVVQQHYYPYGYMPSYPYNLEAGYGAVPMVQEEKPPKEDRIKESPSPIDQSIKQAQPIPNPIQVPTPGKVKEASHKEKHQNDNHQILKESIEIKNQMNSYMYSRPTQQQQVQPMQQQQPQQSHHAQREEDVRRFYVYSEQRRKEQQQQNLPTDHKPPSAASKAPLAQSPNLKAKEVKLEEKKEKDSVKQEGVKPTMETQGPPPPPTSQYAYIHPSYMQQAHYGALPFDPNHPMYRGIMVPGPYSGSPYIHAPIQRYHAPEDLSRAPPPTKALDMLQHHAQYYSSHKIHELQERAIKSPTPNNSKASSLTASSPSANANASGGPGGGGPPTPGQPPAQMSAPPAGQQANNAPAQGGKQQAGDGGSGKESRSPPPQRHVHTHHHTHVGLGYPMYPAPYGATVLASQQAAAVTVINPYPTK